MDFGNAPKTTFCTDTQNYIQLQWSIHRFENFPIFYATNHWALSWARLIQSTTPLMHWCTDLPSSVFLSGSNEGNSRGQFWTRPWYITPGVDLTGFWGFTPPFIRRKLLYERNMFTKFDKDLTRGLRKVCLLEIVPMDQFSGTWIWALKCASH
jgi:hypothetical protein